MQNEISCKFRVVNLFSVFVGSKPFFFSIFADSETKAGVRSSPAIEQVSSTITSSSSTSTTTSSLSTSDQPSGSPRDGQEVSPPENKKPTPMAFTIELGGGGTGSGDLTTSKKLDISASISKWAPKHRRNLSLTKVEEHKVSLLTFLWSPEITRNVWG